MAGAGNRSTTGNRNTGGRNGAKSAGRAQSGGRGGGSQKNRRRRKRKRRLILLALEALLLVILLLVAYFMVILNKIEYEGLDSSEAGINEDLDEGTIITLEGYTNIALFGLDNRSSNNYGGGNSDVIMIASINNRTKDVKLVSVYRDTCLSIGEGSYRKANAAYARGGAKQAVQMLNSNLDLDITEYICVDWAAMVEVIDALGGLDLDITKDEMSQINRYKKDVDKVTGLVTPEVTEYGASIHLDGTQATTYARIRKLAGDDFKRASRQRIVLQAMLDKAKKADVGTLLAIVNAVVDDISTSLTTNEILALAKDIQSYSIESTTGFPFDLTTATVNGGDTVVPAELTNNVEELHEYMFGATGYIPSQTVRMISDTIVQKTGITVNSSLINTDDYNETVGATGTDSIKKSTESN